MEAMTRMFLDGRLEIGDRKAIQGGIGRHLFPVIRIFDNFAVWMVEIYFGRTFG
jgi:hypothetical protein